MNKAYKEFNLEKAIKGDLITTRSGLPVRIICFDKVTKDDKFPIVALVTIGNEEVISHYNSKGFSAQTAHTSDYSGLDLGMLPEKKEGWINIYKGVVFSLGGRVHDSYETAVFNRDVDCIDSVKVEWYE